MMDILNLSEPRFLSEREEAEAQRQQQEFKLADQLAEAVECSKSLYECLGYARRLAAPDKKDAVLVLMARAEEMRKKLEAL